MRILGNTSNNNVTISFNSNSKLIGIEISNVLGQVIYSTDKIMGNGNLTINTTNWDSGIYFIKCKDEDSSILNRKLFINK